MRIVPGHAGLGVAEDESVRRARAMFRRVLPGWAGDLMGLRRRGLDRPTPRRGVRALPVPGWTGPGLRAG